MNHFIRLSDGKYPYTLHDLRTDNPNTSFSYSLTDEEIADFGIAKVFVQEKPEFNSLTHNAVRSNTPELIEGQWLLTWTVVEKPPQADWDNFNATILTNIGFNTIYATVLTTAPLLATSLPTALSQVATNGVSGFANIFNMFCTVGGATSEQRREWGDIADEHHLPSAFVNVINGTDHLEPV